MSDIILTRGDDRTLTSTVTDEAAAIVNLTGVLAVAFTVRREIGGGAVLTKTAVSPIPTTGAGITIPTPANGQIKTNLVPADTATLAGTYVWDVELLDAAGKTTTIDSGSLLVQLDISGAGVPQTVVSVDQVRALVATTLSDAQLQELIAREEVLLAAEVAALSGSRVEVITITEGSMGLAVRLRRPTAVVALTENNIALTDVRLGSDGRTITRLTATGWGASSWLGVLEATYTPNDTALVTTWVIELVRARLTETGYESETTGDYSYRRAPRSYASVMADAVAAILGRGSAGSGLRSIRMSTSDAAPAWVGTARP